MQKIYHVMIQGRTLESRDIRELLARAVAQKRNLDRKSMIQKLSRGQSPASNSPRTFMTADRAAAV
mgnify:FL=1